MPTALSLFLNNMNYILSFIFLFFTSIAVFSQEKIQNNSFTPALTLMKRSDTTALKSENKNIVFGEKPERKHLKKKSNQKKQDRKNISDFQFTPEPTRIYPANKK